MDDAQALIAAMELSKWQVTDYGGPLPKHLYRRVAALIVGHEVEYVAGSAHAVRRGGTSGWLAVFTDSLIVDVRFHDAADPPKVLMGFGDNEGDPGTADVVLIPRSRLMSLELRQGPDAAGDTVNDRAVWSEYGGKSLNGASWPEFAPVSLRYEGRDEPLEVWPRKNADFVTFVASLVADLS
jgi:hypothetical protein